jgi:glucosamine-phosphate N-acetyltransferase
MDTPLFSTDLIPESVACTLPTGYTLRPLQSNDFDRGVLDVLAVLTTVGDISKSKYLGSPFSVKADSERFEWLRRRNDSYFTVVIENDANKIVAIGSLLIEAKLYYLPSVQR